MFWRRVRSSAVWLTASWLLWQTAALVFGVGDIRRHHVETAAFAFVAVSLVAIGSRRSPALQPLQSSVRPGHRWTVPIGLAGLAVVVFGPAVSAGLFADDFELLAAAREGRYTTWTELFRPVVFVVWRLVAALPVDTAPALHLLNLVLHLINALLVVQLARHWRLGEWAIVAGALFVVCPVLVEPVVWAAGVQDVLMTTGVLGVLVIAAAPERSAWRYATGCAAVVLACLTKETAAAIVPLAILAESVAQRRVRPTMFTVGVATLVVVFVVLRVAWLPMPDDYAAWPTRYELKELLVRPFATLALPMRTTEIDAMPLPAFVGVAIVVGLIGLAAVRWTRDTPAYHTAAAGAVFVWFSLVAVNRLFFVDDDLLNSRYIYLGAAGWGICLAALLREADEWRPGAGRAVSAIVVVGWTLLASAHVSVWTDAAALRDRMLSAVATARPEHCTVTSVSGLPAIVDGVPMFINGFPAAMRERHPGMEFQIAPARDASCRLTWDGTTIRAGG